MSEKYTPAFEEIFKNLPDPEDEIQEHSNFVPLKDVEKATEYSERRTLPEEYYHYHWQENTKLSEELTEEEKIQWTRPQIIIMGGLPRSGKSTVGTTIEREFVVEGAPAWYIGSDIARNSLEAEIEADLEAKGVERGTQEFADLKAGRLYSKENRQKVYDEMYAEAGKYVRKTNGVIIVDATHITAEKRQAAYDAIMRAYEPDDEHPLPKFTFIEVTNSAQQADRIFDMDAERIDAERKGLAPEGQSVATPESPDYLPYDKSQATIDIRRRDEKLYEDPIEIEHIKVMNNYASKEELIAHIRQDVMAKKPEYLSRLQDIDVSQESSDY